MASEQGCIGNGCGWCLNCDPLGQRLRTALASELAALTASSLSWNRLTTPSGRSWWRLATLGRRTSASGCGSLLPTPVLTGNFNRRGISDKSGDGVGTVLYLMIATPRASDATAGDRPKRPDGRGPNLPAMIRDMVPTPVASMATKQTGNPSHGMERPNSKRGRHLASVLIPTPTARDRKSDKASATTLKRNSRPLSEYGLAAGDGGRITVPGCLEYESALRAALAELAEPSEEMLAEGNSAIFGETPGKHRRSAEVAWRAMMRKLLGGDDAG